MLNAEYGRLTRGKGHRPPFLLNQHSAFRIRAFPPPPSSGGAGYRERESVSRSSKPAKARCLPRSVSAAPGVAAPRHAAPNATASKEFPAPAAASSSSPRRRWSRRGRPRSRPGRAGGPRPPRARCKARPWPASSIRRRPVKRRTQPDPRPRNDRPPRRRCSTPRRPASPGAPSVSPSAELSRRPSGPTTTNRPAPVGPPKAIDRAAGVSLSNAATSEPSVVTARQLTRFFQWGSQSPMTTNVPLP